MGVHQEDPTTVTSEAATQTTHVDSEERDTIPETSPANQRRHRDVDLETRAYFDNFMAISDEVIRPPYETQESLGLGLDFPCTDIEADGGISSPSLRVDDNDSDHEGETTSVGSTGSDPKSHRADGEDRLKGGDAQIDERQERFRDGGMKLREIADQIDKEFLETNSAANEVLTSFIERQIRKTAEDAFDHTIEQVLREFNGSFPQHDEKHQVALVMLCTRRSVIAVNSALNAARDTSECIIGSAMSYIAGHYPGWTDSFR